MFSSIRTPQNPRLTMLFKTEVQDYHKNHNPFTFLAGSSNSSNSVGKSPESEPILFPTRSSSLPNFVGKSTAYDDGGHEDLKFSPDLSDFWSTLANLSSGLVDQAFALEGPTLVHGNAFQVLASVAEKDPKYFMLLVEPGKAVKANSVSVVEVTSLNPTNPEEKEAFCRGLSFNYRIRATDEYVMKLYLTGGGGGGLQSFDLTHTYVGDSEAIKKLWAFAKDKSLTNLIGQTREDCAEKLGKEAESEFVKMVEICPREVLANFYSVELWNILTLEDKVKEDFANLVLCKRPEIIHPTPAAFINCTVPASDWKSGSSTAEGEKKCFLVPDLNVKYEDEAGENAFTLGVGEEKAQAKKRKAEAAASSGEGPDHVAMMPAFLALPAANPPN